LIIIVIHSPPREAHYRDLPPFTYILLTYYIFLITLNVAYISQCLIFTFYTLEFSATSPAGRADEASRPKFTNFKTSHTPRI